MPLRVSLFDDDLATGNQGLRSTGSASGHLFDGNDMELLRGGGNFRSNFANAPEPSPPKSQGGFEFTSHFDFGTPFGEDLCSGSNPFLAASEPGSLPFFQAPAADFASNQQLFPPGNRAASEPRSSAAGPAWSPQPVNQPASEPAGGMARDFFSNIGASVPAAGAVPDSGTSTWGREPSVTRGESSVSNFDFFGKRGASEPAGGAAPDSATSIWGCERPISLHAERNATTPPHAEPSAASPLSVSKITMASLPGPWDSLALPRILQFQAEAQQEVETRREQQAGKRPANSKEAKFDAEINGLRNGHAFYKRLRTKASQLAAAY